MIYMIVQRAGARRGVRAWKLADTTWRQMRRGLGNVRCRYGTEGCPLDSAMPLRLEPAYRVGSIGQRILERLFERTDVMQAMCQALPVPRTVALAAVYFETATSGARFSPVLRIYKSLKQDLAIHQTGLVRHSERGDGLNARRRARRTVEQV